MDKEKTLVWDISIGTLFVTYLVLITFIFITSKQIKVLKQQKSATLQKKQNVNKQNNSHKKKHITYIEQENYLKKQIKKKPKSVKARKNLANFYHYQGKSYQAVATWKELLKKNAKDVGVHFTLAQSYMGMPNTEKQSLHHLRQVLSLAPNHPKQKSIKIWISQLKKRVKYLDKKEKEIIKKLGYQGATSTN